MNQAPFRAALAVVVALSVVLACDAFARPTEAPLTSVAPRTVAVPPTPTPAPTAPNDGEPVPPGAQLLLADGSAHVGTLGSYVYEGVAADAPWLPARLLPELKFQLGTRAELAIPPLEFVRWSVRYADAQDEQGDVLYPLDAGGDGRTPRSSAVFGTPPSGDWVLAAHVYFAGEAGDATYYWRVVVP